MNLLRLIKLQIILNNNENSLSENQKLFIKSLSGLIIEHKTSNVIYYYSISNKKRKEYLYKLDTNKNEFTYSWLNAQYIFNGLNYKNIKNINQEIKEILSMIIPSIKVKITMEFNL